jgi:hypothetical protein
MSSILRIVLSDTKEIQILYQQNSRDIVHSRHKDLNSFGLFQIRPSTNQLENSETELQKTHYKKLQCLYQLQIRNIGFSSQSTNSNVKTKKHSLSFSGYRRKECWFTTMQCHIHTFTRKMAQDKMDQFYFSSSTHRRHHDAKFPILYWCESTDKLSYPNLMSSR